VAFDKYYKPGLPKLKAIRMVAYADENLRVAALQAGDVDLIEYVPWQSMDAIEADKNLVLRTVDGPFREEPMNFGRVIAIAFEMAINYGSYCFWLEVRSRERARVEEYLADVIC